MALPVDSRRNNIDALRLFLAVLVLFSHSYPLATGSERDEPGNLLTRGQITLGGVAVAGFFALSGFLIARSWENSPSAVAFLRRRAARIYPGYLAAVAACLLVVVPLATPGLTWHGLARGAVADLEPILLLRGFTAPAATFAGNPMPRAVNGSLWSISYEAWCYVGVLLLGRAGLLRRRWAVAGLFVAAVGVSLVFSTYDLRPGGKILGRIFGYPPFWAKLLPYYLAGVLAHLYRDSIRRDGRMALAATFGLAVGCAMPHGLELALPTCGTYLLVYLAHAPALRCHGAARYGDFSYGIYLYGFPIQQLIVMRLGPGLHPLALFALALPPTVLLGVLSWTLVERHFLRRKRVAATEAAPPGSTPRARRPWHRFTIRRALLAMPVVALIVVLASRIDPFPRDPMRRAVDEAVAWCRIPTAWFDATQIGDRSTNPSTLKPDQPATIDGPCLLKVARLGFVFWNRELFEAYGSRSWTNPDGRYQTSATYIGSMRGSYGTTSPARIAAIRRILPTLPASQWPIPSGPIEEGMWEVAAEPQHRAKSRALVLGFHDGNAWVTRVYDRENLPPEVAQLFDDPE